MQTGSRVSKLTRLLEEKRAGVNVAPGDRRRIYAWIDFNVCYYPTWDMSRPYTEGGRDPCFRLRDDDGVYPKDHGRSRALEPEPWFAALRQIVAKRDLPTPRSFDLNLTHPQWSPLLLDNLSRAAGGRANDDRAAFKTPDDPDYVALLAALENGAHALVAHPRMDMPGAKPLPQERNFGRVF